MNSILLTVFRQFLLVPTEKSSPRLRVGAYLSNKRFPGYYIGAYVSAGRGKVTVIFLSYAQNVEGTVPPLQKVWVALPPVRVSYAYICLWVSGLYFLLGRLTVRAYSGITGGIFMDYKADRIMDYAVYSLPMGAKKYRQVMDIPMTRLQFNGTACSPWIVR